MVLHERRWGRFVFRIADDFTRLVGDGGLEWCSGSRGKPMSEQAILDRQTTQLDAINRSMQNLQLTAAETQEGDTEGRKTQQGNLAGRL